MAMQAEYPVKVEGHLDADMSRWMWLVKWFLAIPHYISLVFLFTAYALLSVVAFFAILFTGRYPRGIFNFNVGVLRWAWRVSYYAYGALGTDRYPPFTLRAVDYPAKLEIAYPEHLSRGLVLVKWWLLAIPHYLIVGFFVGGTWFAWSSDDWQIGGPGLIGVITFIAGAALLITGTYPKPLFDLVLGLNRWVLRVAAYTGLMTDEYPPFRLDMGSAEAGGTLDVSSDATAPSATKGWGAGSVIALIAGVLLSFAAVGVGAAGGIGLWADETQRDSAGFVTMDEERISTAAHALVAESMDIEVDGAESYFPSRFLGEARIRVTSLEQEAPVFIGIAETEAALAYLRDTSYAVTDDFQGQVERTHRGGAPSVLPGEAGIWITSSEGPGTQSLRWEVEEGDWTVVAMNADGSERVALIADAGLEIPALTGISVGLIVAGAVLLLIAAGLVVAATAAANRKAA